MKKQRYVAPPDVTLICLADHSWFAPCVTLESTDPRTGAVSSQTYPSELMTMFVADQPYVFTDRDARRALQSAPNAWREVKDPPERLPTCKEFHDR
jgi:hypothetical protein